MNCQRLSNLLSAYIDGELTGVEMIEIRHHLDGCPACQDDLNQVRSVKRMMGRLATARPSHDFPNRICARLDEVQPRSLMQTWNDLWQMTFRRLSPAVAAMCLIVLGMVVFAVRGVDDKITASTNPPMIAASSVPSFTMPVSFESQPEPTLRRVFYHPAPQANGNGWIVQASYGGR